MVMLYLRMGISASCGCLSLAGMDPHLLQGVRVTRPPLGALLTLSFPALSEGSSDDPL
jgi:hypothetical protein